MLRYVRLNDSRTEFALLLWTGSTPVPTTIRMLNFGAAKLSKWFSGNVNMKVSVGLSESNHYYFIIVHNPAIDAMPN